MDSAKAVPSKRKLPPLHVVAVLTLAAVCGLALTAVFSFFSLLLLPALPIFLGAIVGLWGTAIDYARRFVKGADDW